MKILALCLILAAPAFAQKPAKADAATSQQPAPAPPAQPAIGPPPQQQQNPCQMLVPIEAIDTLTPPAMKLQIIFANECILNLRAQQLGTEFGKAVEKARQIEAETKPAEAKKEGTK